MRVFPKCRKTCMDLFLLFPIPHSSSYFGKGVKRQRDSMMHKGLRNRDSDKLFGQWCEAERFGFDQSWRWVWMEVARNEADIRKLPRFRDMGI